MSKMSTRAFVILGLAVATGLATAISPYASAHPDGLEKVAQKKDFIDEGKLHSIQQDSPIPDYAFPGIDNERVATGVSGFIGVLFVFALGYGIAYLIRRRDSSGGRSGAPA